MLLFVAKQSWTTESWIKNLIIVNGSHFMNFYFFLSFLAFFSFHFCKSVTNPHPAATRHMFRIIFHIAICQKKKDFERFDHYFWDFPKNFIYFFT